MQSFMLIHPAVWPQHTNVTNRQTGRQKTGQRSDSIGRTVLQTVAQKPFQAGTFDTETLLRSCQQKTVIDGVERGGKIQNTECRHLSLISVICRYQEVVD